MIVGFATNLCLNTTILCGFEHGFHMIVPENTNSTFDNEYMTAQQLYEYHNHYLWPERFADCVSMDEALEMLAGGRSYGHSEGEL